MHQLQERTRCCNVRALGCVLLGVNFAMLLPNRLQPVCKRRIFHARHFCRASQPIVSVRFACSECVNVDLCGTCFSYGLDLPRLGHARTHSYQVMDSLRCELIEPGWTVAQELLMLEGLEMTGFSNWK